MDPANHMLRVRSVEPNRPAYLAGLRRGDTTLEISNFTPAQVIDGAVGGLSGGDVSIEDVEGMWILRDVAGTTKTLATTSGPILALTPVRDVTVLTATRRPAREGGLHRLHPVRLVQP
jgi:S1-C subfamily serine protease